MNIIELKRTDSTTITSYDNKICIIMSPLKMYEKIKKLDEDLKSIYQKYIIKNE
tara:strand:- start:221 stop:382 length:162 start_codon:yes stop_codon:yes gene_type:complete